MPQKGKLHSNIIYGRNPVLEALQEGKKLERVYLKSQLTGDLEKEVRHLCKERAIPLKKVPLIKLDKLTAYQNHQGIAAVGSVITYQELDMAIPYLYEQGLSPVIVMLDNVKDVRNIGSIARSVEVLGGHILILSGANAGMITHESIKASAGALTRLLVVRAKNTLSTIQALSAYGISSTALSLSDIARPLHKSALLSPLCIVMGSEGEGLHRSVEEACDHVVTISQPGKTDSLNVSVATGIVLYELQRQKMTKT